MEFDNENIIPLGVFIQVTKISFPGCSLKNRSSLDCTSTWEERVFLLSWGGAQPRCYSSRLIPEEHFSDHGVAWVRGMHQHRLLCHQPVFWGVWPKCCAGCWGALALESVSRAAAGWALVAVVFPQVFSQIRNEHFSSVFGFLSQKSRNLQAQYDVSVTLA